MSPERFTDSQSFRFRDPAAATPPTTAAPAAAAAHLPAPRPAEEGGVHEALEKPDLGTPPVGREVVRMRFVGAGDPTYGRNRESLSLSRGGIAGPKPPGRNWALPPEPGWPEPGWGKPGWADASPATAARTRSVSCTVRRMAVVPDSLRAALQLADLFRGGREVLASDSVPLGVQRDRGDGSAPESAEKRWDRNRVVFRSPAGSFRRLRRRGEFLQNGAGGRSRATGANPSRSRKYARRWSASSGCWSM